MLHKDILLHFIANVNPSLSTVPVTHISERYSGKKLFRGNRPIHVPSACFSRLGFTRSEACTCASVRHARTSTDANEEKGKKKKTSVIEEKVSPSKLRSVATSPGMQEAEQKTFTCSLPNRFRARAWQLCLRIIVSRLCDSKSALLIHAERPPSKNAKAYRCSTANAPRRNLNSADKSFMIRLLFPAWPPWAGTSQRVAIETGTQ